MSPQAQADARLKCLPPTRRGRRLRTPHAMASLESLWKEGRDAGTSVHALRALSQDAPAGSRVHRRDVLQRRTAPDVGRPGRKIGLQCSGEKASASVAHPGQAGAAQLWPPTRGCEARDDPAQASATRDISATAMWTLWSGATRTNRLRVGPAPQGAP